MPPVVREFFQRRVTLLGPESSGKSTLAAALAKRFNPKGEFSNLMTEYGRIYDVSLKGGHAWCREDFQMLARTHIAMRQSLSRHAGPLLIEDTDALQTMAWEHALLGSVCCESYPLHNPAELYLLLTPDVPWIDDGTRYGESSRAAMFDFLKALLENLKLPYTVINGIDWQRREQLAFDAANDLMVKARHAV